LTDIEASLDSRELRRSRRGLAAASNKGTVEGRPSFEQVGAIEDVYIRRYAGFHRGVAALVGADLAHDAVQEGFARALRRRRQFAGDGPLDAWIWRIVVRTALDLRRTRGPLADPPADVAPPEPERDPELAAAVRALPPRRRLVVFLRYFADLSYAEIAEACGMKEGTVAATLAQAHADLKRTLASREVST
jgi:RNA polymerase sigma-70 factor (ECF subfamily)